MEPAYVPTVLLRKRLERLVTLGTDIMVWAWQDERLQGAEAPAGVFKGSARTRARTHARV